MGIIQSLDTYLTVKNFLTNFESLTHLPLISDSEVNRLFGPEVPRALHELEQYNQQEKLCLNCRSRCCLLVDCELYDPEFSICPIQELRPLLCRMHFCNRFGEAYKETIKTIGDIFLESLIAGEKVDTERIQLLDSPPLGKGLPGLAVAVGPIIQDFKQGRLNEEAALKLIAQETQKSK